MGKAVDVNRLYRTVWTKNLFLCLILNRFKTYSYAIPPKTFDPYLQSRFDTEL